ncbi:MAG: hypothetical protein AAF171_27070 [Cyanobacteria bacterium P01_A01_bin.116]
MIKKTPFNNRSVEAALYYVRLKTHSGASLFDLSEETSLTSTSAAQIVADELLLAAGDRGITLDQWVIVPDAIHALVFIRENRPDPEASVGKPRLLTSFIASFKAATAKRINLIRNQPGSPVWQRSYNEQHVEDEYMLSRLRARISSADRVVVSS